MSGDAGLSRSGDAVLQTVAVLTDTRGPSRSGDAAPQTIAVRTVQPCDQQEHWVCQDLVMLARQGLVMLPLHLSLYEHSNLVTNRYTESVRVW